MSGVIRTDRKLLAEASIRGVPAGNGSLGSRLVAVSAGQVGDDLVGRLAGGGDAGGDADAVVGGACHREAWLGGDGGADSGDPVQVADVVLGQAAAPAG